MNSIDDFLRLATKYVMDDPKQFNELKERFIACEHAKSKAGAAAIGYLIGKDEARLNKDIWETIFNLVESNTEGSVYTADSTNTTDAIIQAMYKWLDSSFEEAGFDDESHTRGTLYNLFAQWLPESIFLTDS